MEDKLRRDRNSLAVAGMGFMAFGFWSAVKSVMYFTMVTDLEEEIREAAELTPIFTPDTLLKLFYAVVLGYLFVDIALRLIVGLSALAEGKGRKKGRGYVILGALMLISNISFIANNLPVFFDTTGSYVDTVLTIIIELTSLFTLAELVYSAIRVKYFKKKLNAA